MLFPHFGLSLLNTIIGIENVNRNAAQYAKQKIANTKIDRILELLDKEGSALNVHKYIEKLDEEIAALIQSESVSMTTSGERDLHYLFENRKHAMRWAEEKGAAHAAPMSYDAMQGPMSTKARNPY